MSRDRDFKFKNGFKNGGYSSKMNSSVASLIASNEAPLLLGTTIEKHERPRITVKVSDYYCNNMQSLNSAIGKHVKIDISGKGNLFVIATIVEVNSLHFVGVSAEVLVRGILTLKVDEPAYINTVSYSITWVEEDVLLLTKEEIKIVESGGITPIVEF